MKWETAKGDVKLAGCEVEIERVDGSVKSVIVRDAEGGVLKVDCYSLRVCVPAKPKMVKRYRLTFKLDENSPEMTADYKESCQASDARSSLSGAICDNAKIEEIEVPEC